MIHRVKYNKNPLAEVVFQLRYPTILSINAKEPFEFQERIKNVFPYYQKLINKTEVDVNGIKQHIGEEINYEFVSTDKGTKINLTSSFIAVSTVKYERWEFFRSIIKDVKIAFEEVYRPAFYIRLGLRYKDVIDRQVLGLADKGWTELICPHILGTINETNQNTLKQWVVNCEFFDPASQIQTRQVFQLLQKIGTSNIVMAFDCDYFIIANVSQDSVFNLSDQLHEKSSTFMRNAITQTLHEAMEPETLIELDV